MGTRLWGEHTLIFKKNVLCLFRETCEVLGSGTKQSLLLRLSCISVNFNMDEILGRFSILAISKWFCYLFFLFFCLLFGMGKMSVSQTRPKKVHEAAKGRCQPLCSLPPHCYKQNLTHTEVIFKYIHVNF